MAVFLTLTVWTLTSSLSEAGLPVIGFGNKNKNENCPIFNIDNVTHESIPLSVVACAMAEVSAMGCQTIFLALE